MEYRIVREGIWCVYEGHVSYGDFVKGDLVYESSSIADCYAWIKIKQEGFFNI